MVTRQRIPLIRAQTLPNRSRLQFIHFPQQPQAVSFYSQVTLPARNFPVSRTPSLSLHTSPFCTYASAKASLLKEFWDQFYRNLSPIVQEFDTRDSQVYTLLHAHRSALDGTELRSLQALQERLEALTREFSEKSIFEETPTIVNLLIVEGKPSAREFLHSRIDEELFRKTVGIFGEHTLEALLIYSLSSAFNCSTGEVVVKLSTFLPLVDRLVKNHVERVRADLAGEAVPQVATKSRRRGRRRGSSTATDMTVALILIDFLLEREVIAIRMLESEEESTDKSGEHYRKSQSVVFCNFELSLLPWKLNLPMVCEPLPWKLPSHAGSTMLSEFTGGYLSNSPSTKGGLLLSSKNLANFNLEVYDLGLAEMIPLLNELQREGFQINQKVLELLKRERTTFEREGLLAPRVLSEVNARRAFEVLAKTHEEMRAMISVFCELDTLFMELAELIQRARYESFLISLATAYANHTFYLPVFLDFRGRVYRSGVMHFHERDLARCLLLFADSGESLAPEMPSLSLIEAKDWKERLFQSVHTILSRAAVPVDPNIVGGITKTMEDNESYQAIVGTSAAYKYKKFSHHSLAREWYNNHLREFYISKESLIRFAKGAGDPFQFMSKFLHDSAWKQLPISQDASASAYQLLSYFTLSEGLARSTNLLASPDGQVQDIYVHLLQQLRDYLRSADIDPWTLDTVSNELNRKLVKKLFMPMVYGKTIITIKEDLQAAFECSLSSKELFRLSRLCMDFWSQKYPEIANFMRLIQSVSWLCVELDREVGYGVPYFRTHQDYKSYETERFSIYDSLTKRRRRVSLSLPTSKRDKRKTTAATVANFLHQKDSVLAMTVVKELKARKAPVYCVHDNFLTTPPFVHLVPGLYCEAFAEMGPPLRIMNDFVRDNLLLPHGCHMKDEELNSDSLRAFLEGLAPVKGSKDWKEHTRRFLKSYEQYVLSVGGQRGHEARWSQFKTQLLTRETNFSVHY